MTNLTQETNPGRLKSRPDFLHVQKGLRLRGPYFLLEMIDRNEPDAAPRVGYTVTRKQGNSVERNRMRRRLREIVRLAEGVSFRPGHDYVLVARRDTLSAPFEEIGKAFATRMAEGHRKISRPHQGTGRKQHANAPAGPATAPGTN